MTRLGGQLRELTDLAALVRDLALGEHEQISLERPARWWHARCMPELLCPVLVGRDQELGVLRCALDRLATGRGPTLVVLGEAGVGKSRLIREAAADAHVRGLPVLVGRAVGRDSPNALRPLAEALFSHLRRSGPPQAPELAPFRPILGRLIPEWRLQASRLAHRRLALVSGFHRC